MEIAGGFPLPVSGLHLYHDVIYLTMNSDLRILLVSNSTLHGHGSLDHVSEEIRNLLGPARLVLFFPYALHDRDGYAAKATERFAAMDYEMKSAHAANDPREAVAKADAI